MPARQRSRRLCPGPLAGWLQEVVLAPTRGVLQEIPRMRGPLAGLSPSPHLSAPQLAGTSSRASDKRAAPASALPYPIAPHAPASCPLSTSQHGREAARTALPSPGALKVTGGLPAPPLPAGHGRACGTSLHQCPALTLGCAEGAGTRPLPGAILWGPWGSPRQPLPSQLPLLWGCCWEATGQRGLGSQTGEGAWGQNGTALQALSCFFLLLF